jgi:hypothetical protein
VLHEALLEGFSFRDLTAVFFIPKFLEVRSEQPWISVIFAGLHFSCPLLKLRLSTVKDRPQVRPVS